MDAVSTSSAMPTAKGPSYQAVTSYSFSSPSAPLPQSALGRIRANTAARLQVVPTVPPPDSADHGPAQELTPLTNPAPSELPEEALQFHWELGKERDVLPSADFLCSDQLSDTRRR